MGSFLRCFLLPGVSVGYIQIFLMLAWPSTPRANTSHSWAALLQQLHRASAASPARQNASLTWNNCGWLCWDIHRRGGFWSHFSDLHANVSSPCLWCLWSALNSVWPQLFLKALPGCWWEPDTAGTPVHLYNAYLHLNWMHWVIGLKPKKKTPCVVYTSWERGPVTVWWWDCKEGLGWRQFTCEAVLAESAFLVFKL